jgi:formylglycine-generating enzyme required for sulfatase activity
VAENARCESDRALVPAEDGWAFCIDRREVTQQRYAAFLAADVPGAASLETPSPEAAPTPLEEACALDLDHAPGNDGACSGAYAPDVTPEHPVSCVDVCDAQAYCRWSGGRLCGGRGGALLDRGRLGDELDASEGYRACAGAEGREHPYGTSPVEGACNVAGGESAPAGSFEACRTPEGVVDLEGNVSEWTHHGGYPQGDDDPDNDDVLYFAVRGGSFASAPDASGCPSRGELQREDERALPWTSQLPHVGFRCCADPLE